MKKSTRKIIGAGAFALLIISAFLYFFVSGKTVANMFTQFEQYEVTLIKSTSSGVTDTEVVLSARQKEMLVSLLKQTWFCRVPSKVVTAVDSARYEIRINGTHENITGVLFSAGSLGGKYFQVAHEFGGKHLRILSNGWNASMDEILASSPAN